MIINSTENKVDLKIFQCSKWLKIIRACKLLAFITFAVSNLRSHSRLPHYIVRPSIMFDDGKYDTAFPGLPVEFPITFHSTKDKL